MFRTKLTLAGLAVAAAVAAPVAQADPARDMHDYLKAQSPAVGHDPWYAYALSVTQAQQTRDPWYRYGISLTQARQSVPFVTDTLAPGGGSSVVASPASNGFDWADAGIGAGVMAGIALLLLGSSRLVQQRRKVVAA